ncbi:MAG: SMC-Scp complex subunit ScpB [Anaerolineae bacterium]
MSEIQEQAPLALEARIEAILFVAGEPVSLDSLAQALDCTADVAQEAVAGLRASLAGRGLGLVQVGRSLQLTSAAAAAADIRRFLQSDQQTSLSSAALETLAIVAYRQPVTRTQVEQVRGVNCDSAMRTLLRLGLVAEVQRLDQPGRPIAYGTTPAFLRLFGLAGLDALPGLPEG